MANAKKTKKGKQKANWAKIKKEYITSTISQRKLAEKYGVSVTLLASKSKTEGWVNQRNEYQSETVTKAVQKSAEKDADQMAQAWECVNAGKVLAAQKCFEMIQRSNESADLRRCIQSLVDLQGILPQQEIEITEDDGLIASLNDLSQTLFANGDDSDLLPEEDES